MDEKAIEQGLWREVFLKVFELQIHSVSFAATEANNAVAAYRIAFESK